MNTQHEVDLDTDPDAALDAVGAAAEVWGGGWERSGLSARIELPVSAGVRHGWLDGRVDAQRVGSGCRVTLFTEKIDYKLHVAFGRGPTHGGAGSRCHGGRAFLPRLDRSPTDLRAAARDRLAVGRSQAEAQKRSRLHALRGRSPGGACQSECWLAFGWQACVLPPGPPRGSLEGETGFAWFRPRSGATELLVSL